MWVKLASERQSKHFTLLHSVEVIYGRSITSLGRALADLNAPHNDVLMGFRCWLGQNGKVQRFRGNLQPAEAQSDGDKSTSTQLRGILETRS